MQSGSAGSSRHCTGEQFLLYQQTIVPSMTRTDQTSHFEVLLRMKGEDSQIIPPDSFLNGCRELQPLTADRPLGDRTLLPLGWQPHPDILQRLGHCAINLSGLSIGDNGLFDFIQACARESAIPAEKICFEVTETAAIAQFQLAQRMDRGACGRSVFASHSTTSALASPLSPI